MTDFFPSSKADRPVAIVWPEATIKYSVYKSNLCSTFTSVINKINCAISEFGLVEAPYCTCLVHA